MDWLGACRREAETEFGIVAGDLNSGWKGGGVGAEADCEVLEVHRSEADIGRSRWRDRRETGHALCLLFRHVGVCCTLEDVFPL